MTSHEDIRDYIIDWNIRFPIDRQWRKKYNLAFNSPTHRESNFIDQLIDIEEDKFFDELYTQQDYEPGAHDWIKVKDVSDNLESSIENFRDEFKDLIVDE